MDPVTSLIFTGVSTVVSAAGSFMQAQAQAGMAEYQAAVARNNQIAADQNARYAIQAGERQAQAQDFKNRALAGAVEAAQGASGLSLESPTFEDIRESSAQLGRLDTATITQEARMRARGYQQEASNFAAESAMARSRASSARTSGFINAGSSILGGASSFSDKWMRFKTAGAI